MGLLSINDMANKMQKEECFIRFRSSIEEYELPIRFNYPHYYNPHPLCQLAARELQKYLQNGTTWQHNFNPDQGDETADLGKMFGVLLVKKRGEVGYLCAFSGKIGGSNQHTRFVPPIVDMLKEDSFFRKGEKIISKINAQVVEILESGSYQECKALLSQYEQQSSKEITQQKQEIKEARSARNERRKEARLTMLDEEFQKLDLELQEQSMRGHYALKDLKKHWKKVLKDQYEALKVFDDRLDKLKLERKRKSNQLQELLFNEYQFLNQAGEKKGVIEIFDETIQDLPPSGAGDCAAPRLLQYAFENNMEPLAMAEFWWGKPPKSEIRKHGHYYPACKSKCEPILSHMLKGIEVEESPLQTQQRDLSIEIIFEDAVLAVIHKPEGMLSVPGKKNKTSVMSIIEAKYPDATGPLMVHRLDRATSGLMLIAKTKKAHEHLQRQFLTKEIQKRYVALLDETLEEDHGIIDLPLRVDLNDRPRQLVCFEHGKPALTKWEVIERKNGRTKVYFYPVTGRTHQLRVHAAHPDGLNASIIGDELYGHVSDRLHLHAEQITFVHPVSGETMGFQVDAEF